MMDSQNSTQNNENLKFCKHCGAKIPYDAVICTACGRQVEELKKANETPNITINNSNQSSNVNTNVNRNANINGGVRLGTRKNKWIALVLCVLFGFFGAHKFYEEKIGMGILYLFTGGLFFIGVVLDFIALLAKPTYYYV